MGVLYSLFLTSLQDYRDYKSLNYYPQKIAFQQKQLSLQHQPKGKALLPVQGSGKVKVGQRVNVRLTNFPDQEFGYLIGRVESISNIPTPEGFYVLEIIFPSGLTTNYDRQLPLTRQMAGSAEIITDDLRLIERFLMPVRKLIQDQRSRK